jgi:hypothetical protein
MIEGKCVETREASALGHGPSSRAGTSIKYQMNAEGERKVARYPQEGEYCMMLDNSKVRRDGTRLNIHDESSGWGLYSYVDNEVQIEKCNLLDDLVNSNPLIKFFSMLAAVAVSLLAICAMLICCSYFQLHRSYNTLERSVHDSTRAAGLPDDYEYDEDNIYMQERASELRESGALIKRKVAAEEEE